MWGLTVVLGLGVGFVVAFCFVLGFDLIKLVVSLHWLVFFGGGCFVFVFVFVSCLLFMFVGGFVCCVWVWALG